MASGGLSSLLDRIMSAKGKSGKYRIENGQVIVGGLKHPNRAKSYDLAGLLQDWQAKGRGIGGLLNPDGTLNLDAPKNPIDALGYFGAQEAQNSQYNGTLNQIENTSTGASADAEAAKARGLASSAADTAAATFERQTRGHNLSDRQQASAERRLGLSRSIAEANSANAARRGVTDRALQADSAGGAISDTLFSQESGGLTSLANAYQQAKLAEKAKNAGKNSNLLGTIGTVAGFALAL